MANRPEGLGVRSAAIVVLFFAGLNGAGLAVSNFRSGSVDATPIALAAMTFVAGGFMLKRLSSDLAPRRRSAAPAERRSAAAIVVALALSLVGTIIVAFLLATPDAIVDPGNDPAVYGAVALLGIGILILAVVMALEELAKARSEA